MNSISNSNNEIISSSLISTLIREGYISDVLKISSQEAFFHTKDPNGNNPLHLACEYGHIELVNSFIKNSKLIYINSINNNQETPLIIATKMAKQGQFNIINTLLENDANVSLSNNFGMTPLHWACVKDDSSLIELLLNNGADIYAKNSNGYFSFFSIKEKNSLEVFFNHKLNLDSVDHYGRSLIHLVSNHQLEIVQFLISHNANINIQDNDGNTPLHIASRYNNINIIQSLLSHNIDINIQNKNGETALDIAIEYNYHDIIKTFNTYQNYNELTQLIPSAPASHSHKKQKT